MRTLDEIRIAAPPDEVFQIAAAVDEWPDFLPHYRWVRHLEGRDELVEMAAWRPFGLFKYPTWWVSEMRVDAAELRIEYHHVRGITKGMDVEWRLEREGDRTRITIAHNWRGPGWPLIGWVAATLVIGPVFIHGIASRTLAGVKRKAEGR